MKSYIYNGSINVDNLDSDEANLIYNVLVANIGIKQVDSLTKEYKNSKDPSKIKKHTIGSFLNNIEVKKNQIQSEIYELLQQGNFEVLKSKISDQSIIQVNELEKYFNKNISID